MKDFKGTKGEWHAIEYAGRYTLQLGAYYGDMDILDYENFSKEEVDANAKLIAASPELLEALQEMQKDLRILKRNLKSEETHNPRFENMSESVQNWIDRNEKAIDKALGEQ